MKTLILSAVLMAFACGSQAGDTQPAQDKEQPACCSKVSTSIQTKSDCSMASDAKACCPMQKNTKESSKQVLLSPKAAALAAR